MYIGVIELVERELFYVIARLEPRRSLLHRVFLRDSPTSFFFSKDTERVIRPRSFFDSLFFFRFMKFTMSMNNRVRYGAFACCFGKELHACDLLFKLYDMDVIGFSFSPRIKFDLHI